VRKVVNRIVFVRQKYIREGERGHGQKCPVAMAIARIVARTESVSVSEQNVRIHTRAGKLWCGDLPRKAIKFIYRFDTKVKVRPIKFRLRLDMFKSS
jgi:hypothetical protein